MPTNSTIADRYGVSTAVGRDGIVPSRLLEAFAAWRLRRRQSAQLHVLSDCMLKDIGVSRWEIDSIVNSPNRDASGRVR